MSEALEFFKKSIAQTSPYPLGLEIARAEGTYLYDKNGKAYLDLIAGIAVSLLGHGHPAIKKAIKDQLDQHLHVMVYGEYVQEAQNNLAQALAAILPESLNAYYLVNSGAEAVEGALKLAKRYTGRSRMVAFRGAYHGSTHGALSVSGNENKKRAFRPLLPDVHFLRFNEIEDLRNIDEETACVIVETIQGDAGIRIPEREFMQALRKRCYETGALLILDEIQCGLGRTGKWFAFEHFDIEPDILCLAKALGGGLPLGLFAADRSVMQSFTAKPMLGHITTFGGNPLACAAATALIEALKSEQIIPQVEAKGRALEAALEHPRVVEIRRLGMFFAIELESAEAVQKVVHDCLEQGVIGFWFLSCPESFRIAPPLNISAEDIKKASRVIQAAFDRL